METYVYFAMIRRFDGVERRSDAWHLAVRKSRHVHLSIAFLPIELVNNTVIEESFCFWLLLSNRLFELPPRCWDEIEHGSINAFPRMLRTISIPFQLGQHRTQVPLFFLFIMLWVVVAFGATVSLFILGHVRLFLDLVKGYSVSGQLYLLVVCLLWLHYQFLFPL